MKWGELDTQILATAEESEKHVHNWERWLGKLAEPAGNKVAATTLTPFRVTSGETADGFGTAILILDSADTPQTAGKHYYDLHKIFVTNVQTNGLTYRLRLAFARNSESTNAAAVANGNYSDVCFKVDQTNADAVPLPLIARRLQSGGKAWASLAQAAADAKWVDFLFGLHEYD